MVCLLSVKPSIKAERSTRNRQENYIKAKVKPCLKANSLNIGVINMQLFSYLLSLILSSVIAAPVSVRDGELRNLASKSND